MKTILYTPTLDWNFMFQRPQQIMRQFARNGWRAIYVNKKHENKPPEEVEPNLWVYHKWIEAVHDYPHVDVLYVTWAKNKALVPDIKADIVLYDSLDDFEVWEKYESGMLELADVVLTTSQILYDKRSQQHTNVHLVRNGCDPDHIASDTTIPPDLGIIIAHHPRPIVGFVGAIGDWVDEKIIEGISKEYTTVVIGPSFGNSVSGNVINLGMKDYNQLPRYYNNIDTFILPFKDTRVARAANPIKMYEYMAAGKPIIASKLPELQLYPELDYLINADDDIEDWLECLASLDYFREKDRDKLQDFARQNSWAERYKQIERALNGQ